ncbi:MAG: hypothetical protein K6G50_06160, partial [bacterium]|nr:hypothetical protein [bacterium]
DPGYDDPGYDDPSGDDTDPHIHIDMPGSYSGNLIVELNLCHSQDSPQGQVKYINLRVAEGYYVDMAKLNVSKINANNISQQTFYFSGVSTDCDRLVIEYADKDGKIISGDIIPIELYDCEETLVSVEEDEAAAVSGVAVRPSYHLLAPIYSSLVTASLLTEDPDIVLSYIGKESFDYFSSDERIINNTTSSPNVFMGLSEGTASACAQYTNIYGAFWGETPIIVSRETPKSISIKDAGPLALNSPATIVFDPDEQTPELKAPSEYVNEMTLKAKVVLESGAVIDNAPCNWYTDADYLRVYNNGQEALARACAPGTGGFVRAEFRFPTYYDDIMLKAAYGINAAPAEEQ